MGGRKEKITAFILLVLILAPLTYTFLLQSRQQKIRHRMKEELEQSLLQELVIPAGELHWFKAGKEIVVDNQLFDIKSIHYSKDGNAYITGLFDKEETFLVHQMKKNWDDQNRNNNGQLIYFLKMIQSLPETGQLNFELQPITGLIQNIHDTPSLSIGFYTISTPPPQA